MTPYEWFALTLGVILGALLRGTEPMPVSCDVLVVVLGLAVLLVLRLALRLSELRRERDKAQR